jgi:hypothetical protein
MWAIIRRFGVIALGVVSLWLVSVIAINLSVGSPTRSVQTYLEALEQGNFGLAATKAGLSSVPSIVPEPSGSVSDPRVVGTRNIEGGNVMVLAEYELRGETTTTFFTLEPGEAVLWLFTTWKFSESPTATLSYQVLGDNRIDVNGSRLVLSALGVPPTSTVFVPGGYEASLTTAWVNAPSTEVSAVATGEKYPLRIRVEATSELTDNVTAAVESYLEDCLAQEVLQPVGCPFGVSISDRVVGAPQWTVLDYPIVSLRLAADRSSWNMLAVGGVVEATVSVQSLFDGSLSEYDETVSFLLEGVVRGTSEEEPVLNFY